MILKDRRWVVRVAGQQYSSIDIEFDIKKTERKEPNSCSLIVYNLNPESRARLDSLNVYDPRKGKKVSQDGNIRVEIEAGYKDGMSLLFRGDLRTAISERDGPSWKTTIEGEDGGRSVLSARVSHSFPAGTPKLEVVKTCAAAMGVGLGNILEVAGSLTGTYSSGTVLDGSAADELNGILRRAKLKYSIQNGVLQFRVVGKSTRVVRAPVISETTGMVGAPVRDATGELIVKTLLIPGVSVGGHVSLKSRDNRFSGTYEVVGIEHKGSTFGDDWHHILYLLPG